MKRWQIVYGLPLEVWVDIFSFPWITHKEFGQLVHKIGNFKFAEHAQFYLHEWGRRTLDYVRFDKDGLRGYDPSYRDVPQTPLPMNIKAFGYIRINHFDVQTIEFLDKIRPLLTGVEICICDIPPNCLGNFRAILTNLAPMLNGIQSLYCYNESAFPTAKEQLFRTNEELAKLKWFEINLGSETEIEQQEIVTFIMNWLAQPENGGPRLLEFLSENGFFKNISRAIREQFLVAKTPRTFAVHMKLYSYEERQVAEFHLENSVNEELHGEWIKVDGEDSFQITRHPTNCKTNDVHKWIVEMTKKRRYPSIWIDQPTLGSLESSSNGCATSE